MKKLEKDTISVKEKDFSSHKKPLSQDEIDRLIKLVKRNIQLTNEAATA